MNIPDQYVRKEYELHKEYIPRLGWIALDIGAYIGLYTLRAARLVGKYGKVIAFEPNPYAWYWLKKNIELNKANNVQLYPVALGDKDTVIEFYCVTHGNIGASSAHREHIMRKPEVNKYLVTYVPMYRLDSLIPKLLHRDQHIDLVKIDVEGFELNVLHGASYTLQKQLILRLVIEVHLDVVKERSVIAFLQEYGYKIDKIASFDHVKKIIYAKTAR